MQKLVTVLVFMSFSGQAAHLDPQARLLAMPEGSFIEVRLLDKSKFHGRLDKLESGGFLITTPTPNHLDLVQRRIAFSELKSVKRVKDSRDYDSDYDKVAILIGILAAIAGPIVFAISGDR